MSIPADSEFREAVPPNTDTVRRPLWSVMIPTYHCAEYLRLTLRSVLQQDPGPDQMQIMVVDDHSTRDDPAGVVRDLSGDRVEFHRHEANRGVVGNLNACLRMARGRLVHLLHGDDLVEPGFYDRMGDAFARNPAIGAAFCRHRFIDGHGELLGEGPAERRGSGTLRDATTYLGSEQRIMTPCIVVRRNAYESLGGFDRRLLYAEDWEMWMRIAARYPVYHVDEPLASYRLHDNSNTSRNVRSGHDHEDTRLAIEMFSRYLPPREAGPIRRRALRTYSRSAIEAARRMQQRHDHEAMWNQLGMAWRMSPSLSSAAGIGGVLVRSWLCRLRQLVIGGGT